MWREILMRSRNQIRRPLWSEYKDVCNIFTKYSSSFWIKSVQPLISIHWLPAISHWFILWSVWTGCMQVCTAAGLQLKHLFSVVSSSKINYCQRSLCQAAQAGSLPWVGKWQNSLLLFILNLNLQYTIRHTLCGQWSSFMWLCLWSESDQSESKVTGCKRVLRLAPITAWWWEQAWPVNKICFIWNRLWYWVDW